MTNEYLSEDILEEDFVKTFSVINRFQFFMGSCRLYAHSRFITPPTVKQKWYTVCCIILKFISNCALIRVYMSLVKDQTIICLNMIGLIVLYTAYVLNVLHARFFNANENIEFYLKLQRIDRLMKIDQWKVLNSWVKWLINVPVTVSVVLCLMTLALSCYEESSICISSFGAGYTMLCFLVDVTLCCTLLSHFILRMKYVNCLLQNHLESEKIPKPKSRIMSRKCIRYYAQEAQNYYETSDTHVYLKEIFNCFTMFQNTHRFQIFIFCLQSVISFVVTFELILYSLQTNQYSVVGLSSFVIFTILDIIAAIFLGIRYEWFFFEVQKTKRLCIDVMALHLESPLREKARKMLQMLEETPPRFSVYDMWDMNAGTLVAIYSLVTSFMVTLLQLAFL